MSSGTFPRLTLVLGGARSGKSDYAEKLVCGLPAPWIYLATAEAHDDDMRARIAQHRSRRAAGWTTIEAPLDLAAALTTTTASAHPVLVDCLTLWLTNVMLGGHDTGARTAELLDALAKRTAPCVLVSNEVGMGIVPDNALARRFRDEAGRLNQSMAATVDRVVLVCAGLPLILKG